MEHRSIFLKMATRSTSYYCSVPFCKSWSKKDFKRELSFHQFPPQSGPKVYMDTKFGRQLVDRREAWKIKLKIGKPISIYMKVCSLHFTTNDYITNTGESKGKRRVLKNNAIPSQNLPLSTLGHTRKSKSRVLVKTNTTTIEPACSTQTGPTCSTQSEPTYSTQTETTCSTQTEHSDADVKAAESLIDLLLW